VARLRDNPEDLFGLIGQTATGLRLPQEFVEKDFWIVELLRSLAEPVENAVAVFKGGTSLSKAFSLIERFSEDVDILLEITRPSGPEFGKGSVDKILKGICSRAGAHLGLDQDERVQRVRSETGVHRTVRYLYPNAIEAGVLTAGVQLEMGIRGRATPREVRGFSSYAAEYAIANLGAGKDEYDEFARVEINVLSPVRTLVEKLALVHDLGSRFPTSSDRLQQAGRHFYDIHRLLASAEVHEGLEYGRIGELAADVDAQSAANGWTFTPRPADGYAWSPVFAEDHPCQEVVRSSYETALKLVWGEKPSFQDCLRTVRRCAAIL
jgi:hypothetical protein